MTSASAVSAARAANPARAGSSSAPPRRSSDGRWVVQVGSFSLQQNANSLRDQLRSRNFSASVESVQVSGQTMYRVRVGPHGSRGESEQVLSRLRQAGISSGQVISLNN
jgi:cell division protein FtsN